MSSTRLPVKISIVMPVFNGEKFLREAIESVLAQTVTEFTFWIGDNVSTDCTAKIVESYADPRIRFVKNSRNLGIYGNVNNLIRQAEGDLVQIVCADDRLLPDCLENQIKVFERHPDLSFVYCDTTATDFGQARPPRRYQGELPNVLFPVAGGLSLFCFGCLPGDMTNVMLRKECFSAVGGFREDLPYAGDFDLWARLSAAYSFGLNRRKLTFEREHAGRASQTMTKNCAHIWQADIILEGLFSRVPSEHRWLVKAHGTMFHASHFMLHGLNAALRGQFRTAGLVWRRRSYSFSNVWALLFIITSLNHRISTGWTCRRLLVAIERANGPTR